MTLKEQYEQWLQTGFNAWLAERQKHSQEKLMEGAFDIFVDLYELGCMVYDAESTECMEQRVGEAFEIPHDHQIDEDFSAWPKSVLESLRKLAAIPKSPLDNRHPEPESLPDETLRHKLVCKLIHENYDLQGYFMGMEKNNLILHCTDVISLDYFYEELKSQMEQADLSRDELINLSYKDRLLIPVYEDYVQGQGYVEAKNFEEMMAGSYFSDIAQHFPALHVDYPNHPQDALAQKLDECLDGYVRRWRGLSAAEFKEHGAEMAGIFELNGHLRQNGLDVRRVGALLKVKDPLAELNKYWMREEVHDYGSFRSCVDAIYGKLNYDPEYFDLDYRFGGREPVPMPEQAQAPAALNKKLEANYAQYEAAMEQLAPRQIIEKAAEIVATKLTLEAMREDAGDYFQRFKNPLEVVCDHFIGEQPAGIFALEDHAQTFSNAMEYLEESGDAEQGYALEDSFTGQDASSPDQGIGMW